MIWQTVLQSFRPGSPHSRRAKRSLRPKFQPSMECLEDRAVPSATGSIAFNFNGTAIAAGNTIWFSSAFKVDGLPASGATYHFTSDTISSTANGQNYTINAPDADVTIGGTGQAATTFQNGAWETTLPAKFSGSGFMDAVAYQVPAGGLPGGIKNVTWQGQFSTDSPGISVKWQWAAGVYNSNAPFGDYNALQVKPVDDNHVSAYQTSDHAGTPEAFTHLPYMLGGATGGGGSNFTGSLSSTQSVTPALASGTSLSGTVTDSSGAIVAGATVTLYNSQMQQIAQTSTDSNGNYQFTGLTGGSYTLNFAPPPGDFNDVGGSIDISLLNGSHQTDDFTFGTRINA
jgi:Carboxypeptidase regulatory-like domain